MNNTFNPNGYTPFVVEPRSLPEQWKMWVAENIILGNDLNAIVNTLVAYGLDRYSARQEVFTAANSPYLKVSQKTVQALKKLESHLKIYTELQKLLPQKIDRVETITPQEFLQNYYATNTPLIMTGMMKNWAALQKWTPAYFADRFGDVKVSIQTNRSSNPLYEIESEKHRSEMTLKEYIDLILSSGSTNDFYMTANNGNLDRLEFKPLFDDMELFPGLCKQEECPGAIFFWLGPQGTITPLHHDPCNLMMAQVYGRKKWQLISPHYTPQMYNYRGVFSAVDLTNPNYDRFPLFREVTIIEEVLEPGDLIFVPVGWWHFVEALDISISVSMTHFVFPNSYNWKYPNYQL